MRCFFCGHKEAPYDICGIPACEKCFKKWREDSLEFAIEMVEKEKVSVGKGAEIAGMTYDAFLRIIETRKLKVFMGWP